MSDKIAIIQGLCVCVLVWMKTKELAYSLFSSVNSLIYLLCPQFIVMVNMLVDNEDVCKETN